MAANISSVSLFVHLVLIATVIAWGESKPQSPEFPEPWKKIINWGHATAKPSYIQANIREMFDYARVKHADKKTFEEYNEQVRLRGRQLMEAIQAGYPDIVLLFNYGHSEIYAYNLPYVHSRGQRMQDSGSGLKLAFLNGTLEAAGPGVRLVDGQQSAYFHLRSEDYFRGFHDIRQGALALVPPELRSKYRAQVEVGVALYVNNVFALREGSGNYYPWLMPTYHLTTEERLRLWEQNVFYALKTADEYVWCYDERMAIPWTEIKVHDVHLDAVFGVRPDPGSAVRANFYRYRAVSGELTSWSQMFHRSSVEPEHFGLWKFAE